MTVKIKKIWQKTIYNLISIKGNEALCRIWNTFFKFNIKDIIYLKEKYSFRNKYNIELNRKKIFSGTKLCSYSKREVIHYKEKIIEYLVKIWNNEIRIPSYEIYNKKTLYINE